MLAIQEPDGSWIEAFLKSIRFAGNRSEPPTRGQELKQVVGWVGWVFDMSMTCQLRASVFKMKFSGP